VALNTKNHQSIDSPKGQWSEVFVAQKYFTNQTKGHM